MTTKGNAKDSKISRKATILSTSKVSLTSTKKATTAKAQKEAAQVAARKTATAKKEAELDMSKYMPKDEALARGAKLGVPASRLWKACGGNRGALRPMKPEFKAVESHGKWFIPKVVFTKENITLLKNVERKIAEPIKRTIKLEKPGQKAAVKVDAHSGKMAKKAPATEAKKAPAAKAGVSKTGKKIDPVIAARIAKMNAAKAAKKAEREAAEAKGKKASPKTQAKKMAKQIVKAADAEVNGAAAVKRAEKKILEDEAKADGAKKEVVIIDGQPVERKVKASPQQKKAVHDALARAKERVAASGQGDKAAQ